MLKSKPMKTLTAFIVFATFVFLGALFLTNDLKKEAAPSRISATGKAFRNPFYKKIGDFEVALDLAEAPRQPQYTVQLDKVYSQKEAEQLLMKYKKQNLDAYYTPLHQNGRVFFRVRYGVLDSEEKAKELARQIRNKYGYQGMVTRL